MIIESNSEKLIGWIQLHVKRVIATSVTSVRTEIRNVIIEDSRKMCDDFFPSLHTILKVERYQMILIKGLSSSSRRTKFSFRKGSANP
jgi:hypothetical protein